MFDWTHYDIKTNQDAENMRALFKTTSHDAAGFDTETDGLEIVSSKPFLYQFGWVDIQGKQGWTFAVDLQQQPKLSKLVIKVWHSLVKDVPIYLAHNVKFDLHMCANIELPYRAPNISDSMIWIRLGSDAIPERFGGVPMRLKPFATKYISTSAKDMDSRIQAERAARSASLNLKLKQRLHWTKGKIDTFFKDAIHEAEDLPELEREKYNDWLTLDVPIYLRDKITAAVETDMIPYDVLDRPTVRHYGHLDIVWLLEAFVLMRPIVEARGNLEAVKLEEANIYPIFDMERCGLSVDVEYLQECRVKVKQYIKERREDLYQLAGCTLSVGQHALIKEILYSNFGLQVLATGADELDILVSDLIRQGDQADAVEFIKIIQELRTMEKWYSTYIVRFLNKLKHTSTIYTTINLTGTATGRVSCDLQQFPKDAIYRVDGSELFHPRKMILVAEAGHSTVYLDYSQIELRLQAMYTILVGHPDINLCRAYMPYKCHTMVGEETHQSKKAFLFDEEWCIKHAYDTVWYYDEDPEKQWTPLDVHGATTKAAFDIDETHPDFHALRYKGKRVNFAKNYGAQFAKIKTMFPEYGDEQIHRIDDAYYIAFPGVKEYHRYCYAIANRPEGIANLYGVKYWGVSGHKLINMLVQGSAAYFLKQKIVEVTDYLTRVNAKSKFVMQIHDELMFDWDWEDDPSIFFEIKRIMEDYTDTLVPIVAEMELTHTNWAEKKPVNSTEEFYQEEVT